MDRKPISPSEWKWFGFPGHFISARNCRFRLCTQVGGYLVSTVGSYWPTIGEGEEQEIGCGRKYETMVFRAGEPCTQKGCNCGQPVLDPALELAMIGCNTPDEAQRNHMVTCARYAAMPPPDFDPCDESGNGA